MTHSFARRWAIMLLILMPLIVSTACLSLTGRVPIETPAPEATRGSPTTTQAPVVTEAAPAETQPPAVTEAAPVDVEAPDEIFIEGEVVFGPGPFNFLEPAVSLVDLASYKATLSLSFVGTEAGQPSQWSRTYVMLSTLAPLARQVTIESAGQLPDPEPVYLAEVEGTAYAMRGDAPCTAEAIDPEAPLAEQMEPSAFLAGVIGAEEAGSETVNGVEAQHYTFDERALGLLDVAQATGELWVAADGGYLVQYSLVTQAGADYFGEGIEGTATWNYALTDIAQPLAIALPADCPSGMVDAPRLPDAKDLLNVPGLVSYVTASTPAEAAAFYQQQLPVLGWQPVPDAVVAETMALLDFTRAGQQLSVVITADEAGTSVLLELRRTEP